MVKKIKRFTLADWPESAKKGEYSDWETNGESRAKGVVREIWDKNAKTTYDACPNAEQCERGEERICDSLVWRLIQEEEEAPDPNEVIKRVQNNGPFSYVELKKEHMKVDLFRELVLATTLGFAKGDQFEEKSLEQFSKNYAQEVASFADKLGKQYAKTVKSKKDREGVLAQFQGNVDEFEKLDSETFRRWLLYFLMRTRSDLKNYRGRAPLRYFLRIPVYHLSKEDRRMNDKQDKKQRIIEERLAKESAEYDDSNPLDILALKYDVQVLKKALLALRNKNREWYKVVFLHAYEDLEFSRIGFLLEYDDNYEAARKAASRKWDKAVKVLEKLCKTEQKDQTESE